MTQQFGMRMRELMAARDMSLRKLAKAIPANVGHLSRVARDLKSPSPEMAERIDAVLDAGGELAALRTGAPALVLADLLPAVDLDAIQDAGRIGGDDVTRLAARAHALRLADDVMAGRDLIGPAARELDNAIRLYRESSHSEETGRALLSVIGESAQIVGWITSDAGQHDEAARIYELGIDAAREAGDAVLESNLAGSLAYQVANVGDPAAAVARADAAVTLLEPSAPARARALAWDRLAWANVRAGRAPDAMRALGEASAALAEHDDSEPDPPYLYWVDGGELQIMEARAYTDLRRPLRAVPLLADVLRRYDVTHTRELALYLSWLAVALVDAHEPEEAARTAARMLTLGADVASDRTATRTRVVLSRLEEYRDVPEVRDVLLSVR